MKAQQESDKNCINVVDGTFLNFDLLASSRMVILKRTAKDVACFFAICTL